MGGGIRTGKRRKWERGNPRGWYYTASDKKVNFSQSAQEAVFLSFSSGIRSFTIFSIQSSQIKPFFWEKFELNNASLSTKKI